MSTRNHGHSRKYRMRHFFKSSISCYCSYICGALVCVCLCVCCWLLFTAFISIFLFFQSVKKLFSSPLCLFVYLYTSRLKTVRDFSSTSFFIDIYINFWAYQGMFLPLPCKIRDFLLSWQEKSLCVFMCACVLILFI